MPLEEAFCISDDSSSPCDKALLEHLPLKWIGVALADYCDGAVDSDNDVLQLACVPLTKVHWANRCVAILPELD